MIEGVLERALPAGRGARARRRPRRVLPRHRGRSAPRREPLRRQRRLPVRLRPGAVSRPVLLHQLVFQTDRHHQPARRGIAEMAAASGRDDPAVSERLFAEAHRFDFFQAVRILNAWRWPSRRLRWRACRRAGPAGIRWARIVAPRQEVGPVSGPAPRTAFPPARSAKSARRSAAPATAGDAARSRRKWSRPSWA